MKNYIILTLASVFSGILSATLVALLLLFNVILPFQKAAVDRGFATWEVTNNAIGTTKFTWNELAQGLHRANPDVLTQNEKPL